MLCFLNLLSGSGIDVTLFKQSLLYEKFEFFKNNCRYNSLLYKKIQDRIWISLFACTLKHFDLPTKFSEYNSNCIGVCEGCGSWLKDVISLLPFCSFPKESCQYPSKHNHRNLNYDFQPPEKKMIPGMTIILLKMSGFQQQQQQKCEACKEISMAHT